MIIKSGQEPKMRETKGAVPPAVRRDGPPGKRADTVGEIGSLAQEGGVE